MRSGSKYKSSDESVTSHCFKNSFATSITFLLKKIICYKSLKLKIESILNHKISLLVNMNHAQQLIAMLYAYERQQRVCVFT